MAENQDIFKIAVSIVMIHICLIFIMAGSGLGVNPTDLEVSNALAGAIIDFGDVEKQVADSGLCLQGTATQSECEAKGCVWSNNQCLNALQRTGSTNFNFLDLFQTLLNLPIYLGRFILFLGSVVFYETTLLFTLSPLIASFSPMLAWFISLILIAYQIAVLYYVYAFISNWRGTSGSFGG